MNPLGFSEPDVMLSLLFLGRGSSGHWSQAATLNVSFVCPYFAGRDGIHA